MSSTLKDALEKKIAEKAARPKKAPKKNPPFHGTWQFWSVKDSRWIANGISDVGGDQKPPEMKAKIEEFKQKFGDPPGDIDWSYRIK